TAGVGVAVASRLMSILQNQTSSSDLMKLSVSPVAVNRQGGTRGKPADRPEHTAAGHVLAICMDADLIEADVVVGSDDALIARHENELACSTDIASRPGAAQRRAIREVR